MEARLDYDSTSAVRPSKEKIKLLRSHQISVCNGGTLLELSEHQGKSTELFKELVDMGCDSTEISSGSSDITPERIVELITEAKGIR